MKDYNNIYEPEYDSGYSYDCDSFFKTDNSQYKNCNVKKLSKEESLEIYKNNIKTEFLTSVVKCKIRKKESLNRFEPHMFEESYYTELMLRLRDNEIDYKSLKNSSVQDFIDNEMKIQSELFEIEECPIYYLSIAFLRMELNEMDNVVDAHNFNY